MGGERGAEWRQGKVVWGVGAQGYMHTCWGSEPPEVHIGVQGSREQHE